MNIEETPEQTIETSLTKLQFTISETEDLGNVSQVVHHEEATADEQTNVSATAEEESFQDE